MEDGSSLEDLSMLGHGEKTGAGEVWVGSPARPRDVRPVPISNSELQPMQTAKAANRINPLGLALLHGLGLLIFPVLVVAALFPGIVLMNRLNYLDPYYWYLLLSPLVASSFVGLLCVEIVALKWILLGKTRPGQHSTGVARTARSQCRAYAQGGRALCRSDVCGRRCVQACTSPAGG